MLSKQLREKGISCGRNFGNMIRTAEFVLLVLLSVITYFPFLSAQMNNADGFTFGVFYHGEGYGTEDNLGRFFLRFFDFWRDGMILPWLITSACICFLLCSVLIVWKMFEMEGKVIRLVSGILIVCTPSMADLLTYQYAADGYCFGFLLAAVAAMLLVSGSGVLSLVLAAVCILVSLGLYQAYIAVTITLCGFWLLIRVLENKQSGKELWRKTVRFLIGGVTGLGGYLALFTLLDKIHYLSKDSSKGSDHLWGNFVDNLLSGIQEIYSVFKAYYLTDDLVYNSWHARRYVNLFILGLILIMSVIIIWRKALYRKISRLLCALGLLVLIPVMLEIVILMAPGTSVYAETGLLMLCAMNLLYLLPLLLLPHMKMWFWKPVVLCAELYMALFMCIFIGVFARMEQVESDKFQMLAYGMEMRLETLEDYQSGMKVCVVGRPQSGNYPFADDTYKTITKGMISDYSLTFGRADQVSNSWIMLFKYYCGVNYEAVTDEEREQILASEELQEMGIYPAESSVQRIGDIAVIRLSE